MNEAGVIKRILVGFDLSSPSYAALDAALTLAERLGAEIEGLYVEDIELLRLAELPFSAEIHALTSQPRTLDPSRMESELREKAEQAALQVEQHSQHRDVSWRFRRLRGVVSRELVAAASGADLVVIGRVGNAAFRSTLGSTAAALLADAPATILLTHPAMRPDDAKTVVLFDGSDSAEKALLSAARLTPQRTQLHIYLVAAGDEEASRLKEHVATLLAGFELLVTLDVISPQRVPGLLHELPDAPIGLLVISAAQADVADSLRYLAERAPYPLLIVRT